MSGFILRPATEFLFPLMLLFSLFLLLRGHNAPGGGFSGGLVAAGAFVLHAIAFGVEVARRSLRVDPRILAAAGLLLAAGSGVIGWVQGTFFLEGVWWSSLELGSHFKISLGTPLLFDFGVYLTVLGGSLVIMFALMEE